MDAFDLARLSDYDFEALCKDLFEDILGVRLEIFPRGPDGGIDLRHIADDGKSLVIQCKRWAQSSRAKLIRHMRTVELSKIANLSPVRYILATTVDLTVEAKDTLKADLDPYVRSTEDLYGLGEIAEALRQRERIVRRHIRLWLGSTAVLHEVVHKDIAFRSMDLLDSLDECVRTFVSTPAFEHAESMLDAESVCLLTGIPGIGKTTTAKILVKKYINLGYQPVDVFHVKEVGEAWLEGVPQIFFYDDFLGSTALDLRFGKNEDSALTAVVRRIRRTPGKLLVLATREYILARAKQHHPRLDDDEIDWSKCTVGPDALTPGVRANILYNHLHHSGITPDEKRKFARADVWSTIVEHPNFNPRLIAGTVRLASRGGRTAKDVADQMIRNLENPERLWAHLIEEQLDDAAVRLLEVMATFPSEKPMNDVRRTWAKYRLELGETDNPRFYRRALRTLESSMITIASFPPRLA